MRIAHVTATFLPCRNGTATVCYHNASELVRRGHEVHVFTPTISGVADREDYRGMTVHRLRPALRMGNAAVLPQLGSLPGFDVIHLHYPFFGGELAALAAWASRTPLVITYHQDVILSGLMGAVEKSLRLTVGRATLRAAARVLFTSRDYSRVSVARGLLQGREVAVGELPNGVDCTVFTPGPPTTALRAALGLVPEDQVILLVAALDRPHYFKGVPHLLAALARLPKSIKAVIVGDGNCRCEYETTASELGLAERIRFAGRVDDEALPDYYRMADATVLPSTTMGEAFGLVLIESLACATPVIASNLPGVRTVVDDGRDGLLVEPGGVDDLAKKITVMLADPDCRAEMGYRGRAKVSACYAWPAIGEQLEGIYASVLRFEPGRIVSYGQ